MVHKQPSEAELFCATWDNTACLSSGNIPHGDKQITGHPT